MLRRESKRFHSLNQIFNLPARVFSALQFSFFEAEMNCYNCRTLGFDCLSPNALLSVICQVTSRAFDFGKIAIFGFNSNNEIFQSTESCSSEQISIACQIDVIPVLEDDDGGDDAAPAAAAAAVDQERAIAHISIRRCVRSSDPIPSSSDFLGNSILIFVCPCVRRFRKL